MEEKPGYVYDTRFYEYLSVSSGASAAAVVPVVLKALAPGSILDVGCGAGAWLAQYRRAGVTDLLGVDGSYVDRSRLHVPAEVFSASDVSSPFSLGRTFDLVQCLEVAEHIPRDRSDTLINNLTSHGRRVLFSAATPGQGGENHINEQNFEYWRRIFASFGFMPFDFIRSEILSILSVEPWYRYNTILYVHESAVTDLPSGVRGSRTPDGVPIKDVAPLAYRIRCAMLAQLPNPIVTRLARIKHKFTALNHQDASSQG